jgi:hypothetical protein
MKNNSKIIPPLITTFTSFKWKDLITGYLSEVCNIAPLVAGGGGVPAL